MSKQSENLKIGLLDNGSHSLKRGFEMWSQWEKDGEAWCLKESVIWVHHGIELVLKQLLVQTNEFLVFQDVNKAVERLGILRKKPNMRNAGILDLFDNDDNIMSVGFKSLIERVAIALSISEFDNGSDLRSKIDCLTRYRNKIVHFSLDLDVVEVSSLLSDLLFPLLSVLSREIKDTNFKYIVIPEIMKLAQPVQKYLDFVRSNIVDSAIAASKKALLPNSNGMAGVVVQALGSGMSMTVLNYLKELVNLDEFKTYRIVILVDRLELADQLQKIISENSNIYFIRAENKKELVECQNLNKPQVIITTIQNLLSDNHYFRPAFYICYNLHYRSERLTAYLSNETRILFTNICSLNDADVYGEIVGMYTFQQVIHDELLSPIKIEKI